MLTDEFIDYIKVAYAENPEPVQPEKKRGRVKRGKILALIDRLQKYKGAVCLFLEKIGVPFDNNQAERDIRNIKTKTKVCGCFRNETGAEEYMGLMSFISTARKNGFDSYHAIEMALSGQFYHICCGGSEQLQEEKEYNPHFRLKKRRDNLPVEICIKVEHDTYEEFEKITGISLEYDDYTDAFTWIVIYSIDSADRKRKLY